MTQLITHIKVNNGDKTQITVTETVVSHQMKTKVTRVIESDEIRHPDFDHAAKAIGPLARTLLGIPKEWDVEFKNVSIDRDDGFSASLGLYIKFGKDFATGVNMPSPELFYAHDKKKQNKLPQNLYDALVALIGEADAFAFRNKRAQTSLLDDKRELSDEEFDEQERKKLGAPGRSKSPFKPAVVSAIAGDAKAAKKKAKMK